MIILKEKLYSPVAPTMVMENKPIDNWAWYTDPYKEQITNEATSEFNNYVAPYYYGDEYQQPQQSTNEGGGHLLRNVAIGAGTLGLFHGARKGLFGSTVRKGLNDAWVKVGSKIGSAEMIKSGAIQRSIAELKLKGGYTDTSGVFHKLTKKEIKEEIKKVKKGLKKESIDDKTARAAVDAEMKATGLHQSYNNYLRNTTTTGTLGHGGVEQSLKSQLVALKMGGRGNQEFIRSDGKTVGQVMHEQGNRSGLYQGQNAAAVRSTIDEEVVDRARQGYSGGNLKSKQTQAKYNKGYNYIIQ